MDSVQLLQQVSNLHSPTTDVTKRSQSDEHFQWKRDFTILSKKHDRWCYRVKMSGYLLGFYRKYSPCYQVPLQQLYCV